MSIPEARARRALEMILAALDLPAEGTGAEEVVAAIERLKAPQPSAWYRLCGLLRARIHVFDRLVVSGGRVLGSFSDRAKAIEHAAFILPPGAGYTLETWTINDPLSGPTREYFTVPRQ